MSNREFGEIVQGPMTEDGPSVDDLRAQMYGGRWPGGTRTARTGPRRTRPWSGARPRPGTAP